MKTLTLALLLFWLSALAVGICQLVKFGDWFSSAWVCACCFCAAMQAHQYEETRKR